jgi:hypothetical protein
MMNSAKFAVDPEYRKAEFQTTPEDRPLVAHFSANDPKLFLEAAKQVQDQCDAIGKKSLSYDSTVHTVEQLFLHVINCTTKLLLPLFVGTYSTAVLVKKRSVIDFCTLCCV